MNEELQKQLANIIEKSMQLAEKTGKFVLDQAPDLIQQFLMWRTVSATYWLLFGIALFFVPFLSKKLGKDEESYDFDVKFMGKYHADFGGPFIVIGSIAAWVVSVCMISFNLLEILKIQVAPKIYLIEYFMR